MASQPHNRPQYFLSDTLALETLSATTQLIPSSSSRPFRVLGIDCKLVFASSPTGTALLTGSLALAGISSLAAAILGASDEDKIIAVATLPSLPITPVTGAQSLTVGTALSGGSAIVRFVTWGYFIG